MATSAEVEMRFVRWNVLGVNGDPVNDRLTAGNWSFRKNVLFYQYRPHKRFIRDKMNRPVMISKQHSRNDTVNAVPRDGAMNGVKYLTWVLPDIGVWSWYEGDLLEDAEFHERMQFLFFAELRAYGPDVIKPLSGKDVEDMRKHHANHINAMYQRYDNYRTLFGLGWPDLPDMYRKEIFELMDAKVARYHSPKQVELRERQHARKIAKQAFGL